MKKLNKDNVEETLSGKREDIIKISYEIFYKEGFHATGVDKILSDSGISKRTLYKYFRSKEELISEVVQYYQKTLFATVLEILNKKTKDPKKQILGLFDIKKAEFKNGNFKGCFAINAKLEFQEKNKSIEDSCKIFYSLLEEYIESLCKKAKLKNPKKLARKIVILFDGAIVLGQIHQDHSTMETAKEIAQELILRS